MFYQWPYPAEYNLKKAPGQVGIPQSTWFIVVPPGVFARATEAVYFQCTAASSTSAITTSTASIACTASTAVPNHASSASAARLDVFLSVAS